MRRVTLARIWAVVLFIGLAAVQSYAQETQQFEGFNVHGYSDTGEKAWDVNGSTADVQGDTIEIFDVDANRYGEQEINLKAQKGVINKTSGKLHLEKDVVITSESGGQILTDSLDWDKEKDEIQTDDHVTIKDERMTTTGVGLKAYPGLEKANLIKDITIHLIVEKEGKKAGEAAGEGDVEARKLKVTCDGPMEIDQKNSVAILNENVVAIQTDRRLEADKMEIYFDPETDKIKQMICTGNVYIKQGENVSRSQTAVYNALEEKIILMGRPKLSIITEGEGSFKSFSD